MHPDFYNSDAFSLLTLTATVNKIEHIPGRAGDLAFAGVGEGVSTTSVDVEVIGETLTLVQTSPRGGKSRNNGTQEKSTLKSLNIPHLEIEEGIQAFQVQNVREFGSMSTLRGARSVVDKEMTKQIRRHELTLENLRLGALRGLVKDADGSTLTDLFSTFGVTPEDDIEFDPVFNASPTAASVNTLRTFCQQIKRIMVRNLQGIMPSGARVWALCGDNFFDKLLSSSSFNNVYAGYVLAEQHLGGNYAQGVYEFGDIMWENYQGTNDQSRTSGGTVGIAPDECRFFLTGVPGLYAEYYAPADFFEAVNTIGVPRYAKIAPTDNLNRGVLLHTQQNPLPICLKPKTLIRGVSSLSTGDFNL